MSPLFRMYGPVGHASSQPFAETTNHVPGQITVTHLEIGHQYFNATNS